MLLTLSIETVCSRHSEIGGSDLPRWVPRRTPTRAGHIRLGE